MDIYCHFIHFVLNIFIIQIYKKNWCYFQNTFSFVFMSRKTDDIGKKNILKIYMGQTIRGFITTKNSMNLINFSGGKNLYFVG